MRIIILEARNIFNPGFYFGLRVAGERDLQMANQGVPEEHAGDGLEHRQDQGWREHVSAARE